MTDQIFSSPIFIGGLMKSGTSLLRKLLSLHPHIFGGLETHWFSDDFINHWQDGESTRQQWLGQFFEVPQKDLNQLRQNSTSSFDFFNQFMSFCAKRANKKRWVEKTPDNVFHLDTIWAKWPEAKVLIMDRDLRDVYASWKKNKKRSLENFLEQAQKFNSVLERQNNNNKLLIISYSDLVNQPKITLQKALHFIGEKYIEGLENYQGDNQDYQKVLAVTGKVSPTTESLKKPIFTNSIGQYKIILSSEEIEKIQFIGTNKS